MVFGPCKHKANKHKKQFQVNCRSNVKGNSQLLENNIRDYHHDLKVQEDLFKKTAKALTIKEKAYKVDCIKTKICPLKDIIIKVKRQVQCRKCKQHINPTKDSNPEWSTRSQFLKKDNQIKTGKET